MKLFQISNKIISTIQEKSIKCLGKWFKESKNVRHRKHNRKLKGMCYQHGILPRLIWPLFIYDVSLSTVEVLERIISSYLRRWLNVPRSLSSIGLYSTGPKLNLPLSTLVEKYKVAKVRQAVLLRDSNDKYVSGADIKLRSGRKWQVEEAVKSAEERLRQSDIIGTVTTRAGMFNQK